jgi:hypothetical protein
MTGDELTSARKALRLTAANLGRALQLEGRDPGQSVRLWEKGRPVPGPVAVAVGFMLAEQARQGLQEAVSQAQAILTPPEPLPPPRSRADVVYGAMRPAHNRRRG